MSQHVQPSDLDDVPEVRDLTSGRTSLRQDFGRDVLSLVIWVGIVAVVAFLGGLATSSSVTTWYPTLNQPSFSPPDWVFGPVWSALYVMMAIAAWMIWRRRQESTRKDAIHFFIVVFALQLALNLAWSFIFFGLRSPMWAFVEICVLWVAIAFTVFLGFKQNKWSGYLLLPYLAWASFALVLNFEFMRLNY